jgi:AcrR family transcriptional regulator
MTTTGAHRRYSSPLRAEQAAMTRDRIIDAAVALLQDADPAAIGMQDVADEAGVSVRTVYRAFPTRDDLFDGVLVAIKDRLEASGPYPSTVEEYIKTSPALVQALFQLEPLYRALFATPAGRASHRRGARQRQDAIKAVFAAELASLTTSEQRLFAAAMHLVSSSSSVFFLKDYANLDATEAGAAMRFAIAALAAAITDPELRSELSTTGDAP